jgi:hypothetical protein
LDYHASETPVARRSLAEFVDDYQDAGFFRGANPAVAARRIARDHQREWGEAPPLATRLDELTLLRYDKQRVWFEDLERWAGEEAFVVALYAQGARGARAPRLDLRDARGSAARLRLRPAVRGRYAEPC